MRNVETVWVLDRHGEERTAALLLHRPPLEALASHLSAAYVRDGLRLLGKFKRTSPLFSRCKKTFIYCMQ